MTPAFLQLALFTGYMLALLVGTVGVILVVKMAKGSINLNLLVSEKDGSASLSRFQFLIFTFVIVVSFLLLVLANVQSHNYAFPPVDSGVLTLLGVSGGSYVVSKGIQKSYEAGNPTDKSDAADTGASTAASGKTWPAT